MKKRLHQCSHKALEWKEYKESKVEGDGRFPPPNHCLECELSKKLKSNHMPLDKELEKIKAEEWRKGYDLGIKNALQQNNIALQIGNSILTALDDRYEFKKEDY